MTTYRLFDIEAVLDPTMGPPLKRNGDPYSFAPPPYWRVVSIASLIIDDDEDGLVGAGTVLYGSDERQILDRLARSQLQRDAVLVSFNGRHDVPVIVARCMRHGVAFHWYWRTRGARYRFDQLGTIDLEDELAEFGAADKTGLDTWSRCVDVPPKSGNGDDVAGMWARGEHEQIARYCFDDVRALSFVFARWLRVQGKMKPDEEAAVRSRITALEPTLHRVDLPLPANGTAMEAT